MMLEFLCKVLPTPIAPIESGSTEEWSEIGKVVDIILPSDYKQYINTFGTGCIGNFLWPFNPFSENKFLNFGEQIDARLDALRVLKEKWGDRQCPYPLYPEPEGLLPWGASDNGDVLYWLTAGHPDDWSVIINEARSSVYEEYKESATSLLAKLVLGEIVSEIFPPDFPDREALFVSRK